MLRQKGYSVPLFLIVTLVVLTVPAYYWVSTNQLNVSASRDIRGAASTGNSHSAPGFSVSIVSASPTWDLVEYLCKSQEECSTSLTSGRRLGTVSGGETEFHEVIVEYSAEWQDYKYIKYFVRPGWNASDSNFTVSTLGDIPGSEVLSLAENGDEYVAVIAPISSLKNGFYTSATFSNSSQ